MVNAIEGLKRKLDESISQLEKVHWLFSRHPGRDFTRERKLPFRKMIAILLSMQGGTLATELLNHFQYSPDTASPAAFVQQRSKIHADALRFLFALFVEKTDSAKLYKGYRLLAADGSDIQIPTNPDDLDSYCPGANGQAAYNLLHLDAMYDLLRHTYVDVNLMGQKVRNERRALCSFVDRSPIGSALILADRGYEAYNVMAHIQEKGWKYLIRVRDGVNFANITAGLTLPDADEFDLFVDLSLTTKQTNQVKALCKERNKYRRISVSSTFDYLPKSNRKHVSPTFYHLPFRIVRFKITEDTFETVVTNLEITDFPPDELKKLYAMRWGIETSFRELKYTIGLLQFHSRKTEYICQEVFARLIMYNFSELVTALSVIPRGETKYTYKANFSAAVHVCRRFFLGNISPLDVETLICKYVTPIRPGRSRPRNINAKHAVSFIYRPT